MARPPALCCPPIDYGLRCRPVLLMCPFVLYVVLITQSLQYDC